mmetsp:Transcript_100158/g.258925  ORF Transcript_100158/g.258925 Transcript_100158/m.258925 type:complete len:208 (-) Transcript_100158:3-626(-)
MNHCLQIPSMDADIVFTKLLGHGEHSRDVEHFGLLAFLPTTCATSNLFGSFFFSLFGLNQTRAAGDLRRVARRHLAIQLATALLGGCTDADLVHELHRSLHSQFLHELHVCACDLNLHIDLDALQLELGRAEGRLRILLEKDLFDKHIHLGLLVLHFPAAELELLLEHLQGEDWSIPFTTYSVVSHPTRTRAMSAGACEYWRKSEVT